MVNYLKEVIDKLSLWIEGNQSVGNWLKINGYPELYMLNDAVSRHTKALEYLLIKKHFILAAFVNAIWDDSKALDFLLKNKGTQWAATANYINGDEKAGIWLEKNKLDHYAKLADKIRAKLRKEGDQATSIFNSPIK